MDTLSLPSKAKMAAKWTACKVRQHLNLVRQSKVCCVLFLSKWQSHSISLSSQFQRLSQS